MSNQGLHEFLADQNYTHLTEHDGILYGLYRFIFTTGLIVGLERDGYSHRYCYDTTLEAIGALHDWKANGFQGEPEGFIKRKPEAA